MFPRLVEALRSDYTSVACPLPVSGVSLEALTDGHRRTGQRNQKDEESSRRAEARTLRAQNHKPLISILQFTRFLRNGTPTGTRTLT